MSILISTSTGAWVWGFECCEPFVSVPGGGAGINASVRESAIETFWYFIAYWVCFSSSSILVCFAIVLVVFVLQYVQYFVVVYSIKFVLSQSHFLFTNSFCCVSFYHARRRIIIVKAHHFNAIASCSWIFMKHNLSLD